ncbi:DUF819 domain-containing protein [Salinibacter ruber]|uniref:Membrane protein n=1 Tax=Salinibacter ruber TaxID=146919 RepID=A0A9X2RF62_9BACT|nr:DUF819 family protein [Salinibacter ruber]MBB4090235.1 putative membrane protein [Salinibacter ruber]MCS3612284.1 putative membrane protein [Salinibacter ruber]MCS3615815.1 putative membrane protein [Salinibacter ruber]MCS3628001.1 putative membrane protein [Salinibacter ruber]MCS3631950.1 putative membrane protein [Salinibacter ruber]
MFASPLVSEPMAIIALFSAILGVVFWLDSFEVFEPAFKYLPPVIWAYFVPMLCTTVGLTPAESPVYDWMSAYLLPFSLFLLMVTVDLKAILRLGPMALFMMCAGTLGIIVGGPVVFALFGPFFEDPVAWKGFAALSGSWIGGTANMVAMKQSFGTPDSTLGPLLVVDVVAGYGWMGVLIFLSAYQAHFDDWIQADTTAMDRLNEKMKNMEDQLRPVTLRDLALMIGLALAATVAAKTIGATMPEIGTADATVISTDTWAILLVVTGGLLLSFTPLQEMENAGASRLGYFALYLLLTSIGAKADLAAVLDVPLYLLAGVLWILIHIAFLLAAARMVKAPLFFVATGSMANVGGAASAPIVAGVYLPAMAPVGLLMGVAGYILGIYAALGCGWLIGLVAV